MNDLTLKLSSALRLTSAESEFLIFVVTDIEKIKKNFAKINKGLLPHEYGKLISDVPRIYESRNQWADKGLAYNVQEEIIYAYAHYVFEELNKNSTIDDYLNNNRLIITGFRDSIQEERANWKDFQKATKRR